MVSHHEMGAVEDPPAAEPRIRYRRIGISSSAVQGTRLVEMRQCVSSPFPPRSLVGVVIEIEKGLSTRGQAQQAQLVR